MVVVGPAEFRAGPKTTATKAMVTDGTSVV